jgi:serine/threonine protein kinase
MPEPQASSTRPGELIAGRWRLAREIGRGTTGRVWQAHDEHLEREVAVKVLEFGTGHRDEEMVARFEREIRVTARLSHPGIATVFEAAEDDSCQPCYIMTLARGRTLDQFLAELRQSPDQWRTMPLIDRLTLFLKLLGIMHYAHSQSVVHRDLKPANIVVGDYGELWILDWGLARDLKEERETERAYEQVFDQQPTPPPEVQVVLPGDKPPTQRAEAATVIMDDAGTAPIAHDAASTDRIPTPAEGRPATSARLRPASESQRRGTTSESRRSPSTESVRRSSMRLSRSTHFGQVLGSPAYMPPEQAHGRSAVVDQRADIYSLGSILVELLTLRTPQEMGEHESLVEFLARIKKGDRKTLKDLWSDAPQQLHVIAEWALARDPHDRYPDCEVFAQDLRHLLAHLSESYSEAERARLAKEREGAWRPLGRWDFSANPDSGPFTLPSTAWCGETVGHVHHPELGGMLIGGYGLQIYPLGIEVGDDIRLSVELELVKGEEVWLLARGADPRRSYQFRLGAFEGRWITVQRAGGGQQPLDAELLTMRPMRDGDTTSARMIRRPAHHRLVVECEGQVLRFHVDGQEPLVFRDLDPISVAPGHHLALATFKSQALVRTLGVERRHSPKMVPSYTVGNELLRLGLHRDAEAWYRRFLAEHADAEEAAEASFLRCMSIVRSGDHAAGAEALRAFLSEHLDHPLARDAIFVLARVQSERQGGNLRAALRELLGYQESGDVVRTRFCLWIMPLISARIAHGGLTTEVEHDLEQLAKLMRGSPDEQALMGTMSRWLSTHLRSWLGHLVDRNDGTAIAACRDSMRRARAHGYAITIREPRLLADYARLGRELAATNDPAQTVVVLGRGEDRPTTLFDYVRDSLALIGLGHATLVLESLQGGEELTAVERVLRAGLRRRNGLTAQATEDLEWCFRLTDQLETSRTSLVMLFAARLGCLALGYLPATLVLDGLDTVRDDIMHAPLMALTAWTCESHGDLANARTLYTHLAAEGSGFALIGRQGLERLG